MLDAVREVNENVVAVSVTVLVLVTLVGETLLDREPVVTEEELLALPVVIVFEV